MRRMNDEKEMKHKKKTFKKSFHYIGSSNDFSFGNSHSHESSLLLIPVVIPESLEEQRIVFLSFVLLDIPPNRVDLHFQRPPLPRTNDRSQSNTAFALFKQCSVTLIIIRTTRTPSISSYSQTLLHHFVFLVSTKEIDRFTFARTQRHSIHKRVSIRCCDAYTTISPILSLILVANLEKCFTTNLKSENTIDDVWNALDDLFNNNEEFKTYKNDDVYKNNVCI